MNHFHRALTEGKWQGMDGRGIFWFQISKKQLLPEEAGLSYNAKDAGEFNEIL
jgi:hypothetical protein